MITQVAGFRDVLLVVRDEVRLAVCALASLGVVLQPILENLWDIINAVHAVPVGFFPAKNFLRVGFDFLLCLQNRNGVAAAVRMPARELVSIHAPARGATSRSGFGLGSSFGFNPRTRTGCDIPALRVPDVCDVSIHAPARGATRAIFPDTQLNGSFQSTHPHGVRLPSAARPVTATWFQSTHPHGVRHDELEEVE